MSGWSSTQQKMQKISTTYIRGRLGLALALGKEEIEPMTTIT
jgi:hypothetical protein